MLVGEKIPRKIPHTNPTPPDRSDTTGQVFVQNRTDPTPRDRSDRMHPPHNPSVVGSIPTGPTQPHSVQQQTSQKSFSVVVARLKHHDVITIDEVHESMLFVNPPRPATG